MPFFKVKIQGHCLIHEMENLIMFGKGVVMNFSLLPVTIKGKQKEKESDFVGMEVMIVIHFE